MFGTAVWFAAIFLLTVPGLVWANFEEGNAEYNKNNFGKAYRILIPLAEEGNAKAQFLVGTLYIRGKGVAKNPVTGMAWLRKAARQGVARANYFLGLAYERKIGVEQSVDEALKNYRDAAKQGYSRAQYELGIRLFRPGSFPGHPANKPEALKWLKQAAEQQHFAAKFTLARIYDGTYVHGINRPKYLDKSAALRLYTELAEDGDSMAQLALGRKYVQGQDVGKDLVEAYKWFELAYREERRLCLGFARNMTSSLTTEELCMDPLRDFPTGKEWSTNFSNDRERREYRRVRGSVNGTNYQRKAVAQKLSTSQISEAKRRIEEWLTAQKQRPARGKNRPRYPGVTINWITRKN